MKLMQIKPFFRPDLMEERKELGKFCFDRGFLYYDKDFNFAHYCPCGDCDLFFLLTADNKQGWKLIKNSEGVFSVDGSFRHYNCVSHYSIKENKVEFHGDHKKFNRRVK